MPEPKPVLFLATRPNQERAPSLEAVLLPGEHLHIRIQTAPGGVTPDLADYRAVVVDGETGVQPGAVALLQAFAEAGGSVLVIGLTEGGASPALTALLGATPETSRPRGEIFAKRAASPSDLLLRLDAEFPIVDRLTPLRIANGAAVSVLLHVNWALKDYPVAVERRMGRGRIVTTSLGQTTQALQAPAFGALLRRALRPPLTEPATRPVRAAIVGYGEGMGYAHGAGVLATEGMELVAVCDRVPERLDLAKAAFPGVALLADSAVLARDPDIHLVFVATPPVTHAGITRQLLEAGKHVACEKPLCLTTAEADALIAIARRNGVMLTVNQNRRWDGDYRAVQRAVRAGLLGDLFNIETFVGGFEHPCRYWHSDATVSGGAAFDWGSHYIDWTLQLMPGLPSSVSAVAHKRVWYDVTNADQVRIRMVWDDGREAEFVASDVAALRKPKFYIQGTAGTLEGRYRPLSFERIDDAMGYMREDPHFAEAPADLTLARYESGYAVTETHLPPEPKVSFAFHRNLADHLLLGDALAVTPESVRNVIAVLEAAEQSAARNGAPVALTHQ